MLIFIIYILAIAAGAAIFPLLFNTFIFSSVDLIFYRGIALALVCAIIQCLLILLISKIFKIQLLKIRDLICVAALTFSFNITFLIVFPVTIDRSVTTFLLSKLEQGPQTGFTKEEMEQTFKDEYVTKLSAIPKRMREQIITGNVIQNGNNFSLTNQGRKFLRFCTFVERIYGLPSHKVTESTPHSDLTDSEISSGSVR